MAETADKAEAWEPASEVEDRMRAAVRAADHVAYFRQLAQSELLVPVPSDEIEAVLSGQVQPVWPTAESEGRTCVLAYTSPEAMRATSGAPFRHFLTMRFSDIAEAWPDVRWWLTVNAGLPIQGELPSWYVRQIAGGDPRPPTIGITARALETAAATTAPTESADFVPLPRPGRPPRTAAIEPQPTGGEAPAPTAPEAPATAARPAIPNPRPGPAETQPPAGPEHVAADRRPDATEPGPVAADSLSTAPGVGSDGQTTDAQAPGQAGAQPTTAEPAADAQPPTTDPRQPTPDTEPGFVEGPTPPTTPDAHPATTGTQPTPSAPSTAANTQPGFADGPTPTAAPGAQPTAGDQPAISGAPGNAPDAQEASTADARPGFADGPTPPTTPDAHPATTGSQPTLPGAPDGQATGPGDARPGFADGATPTAAPGANPTAGSQPGIPGVSGSVAGGQAADALTAGAGGAEPVAAGDPQPAGVAGQRGGFEPQNEVEERLYDAASRDDLDAYARILLGAQVLVPVGDETPWGTPPSDPRFPWTPVPVLERPSIVVFTSLRWMHEAVGECRFVMPKVKDVVEAWPSDDWALAINPGTPVGAALTADQIRALARPETADDGASKLRGEFEPGNRIDQELFEAAEAGDTDTFLRVLFAANVLVPIPSDAPLEVPPTEPGFRWDAALRAPSSVQVFTSLVRMKESLGSRQQAARFVYTDFRDLIGVWPDSAWTMLLNPGTRIGASLGGEQVHALNEWAGRVGLLEPPSAREAEARPDPLVEPQPEPETLVDAFPPLSSNAPQPQPQPVTATAGAGSMLMQKVLPPAHVSWYLDQGYDRVGGFVYPVAYTADLQTPAQLYETLGLLYAESPFSLDDDGVYVIRWPAYCEDLYRTPFGGSSEEELQDWGDSGWVVERPPFEGAGFAPGSAGTIREYKVDSTRLPHGAEMYYLGRDRTELFVAMYDPDRLEWVRPSDAGGAPSARWNGHAGGGQ